MKRVFYTALLFLVCFISRSVSATEYSTLLADKSKITFVSKQMGVAVNGEFKKFSGHIKIDPKKLHQAQADLTLEIRSIDTGSPEANTEVLGKNWFNASVFPTASFRLSSVTALGHDKYQIAGKLNIKGKMVDTTTVARLEEQKEHATLSGSFIIKRLDFGLGEGPWADLNTVANEVSVNFQLQLAAKK